MAATKYGKFVKGLSFQEYGAGPIRQNIEMTSEFLGIDANIKYGDCWTGGRLGKEPYVPHVHDYDQLIFFLGSDMNNLSDLWGEVEFCIGEELETHMITSSTTIAIPRGMPHFPATINKLDKRMIYMEVSVAPQCKETPFSTDRKPSEPVGMRSKYSKYFMPLMFKRKGAWTYGPTNHDDGGGDISLVATKETGVDFAMFYENMKKAPYRLCPDPDKPHTHPTTQVMCFMGTDMDDLNNLNAEFEICLGKELERHAFTTPTAVVTPPFLPHWPGGLLKCTKPILMVDVHPFGNDH